MMAVSPAQQAVQQEYRRQMMHTFRPGRVITVPAVWANYASIAAVSATGVTNPSTLMPSTLNPYLTALDYAETKAAALSVKELKPVPLEELVVDLKSADQSRIREWME
jgi:hypothetical protein